MCIIRETHVMLCIIQRMDQPRTSRLPPHYLTNYKACHRGWQYKTRAVSEHHSNKYCISFALFHSCSHKIKKKFVYYCLLCRLFRLTSKKASKPVLLALCEENPPVTSGFLSQKASNVNTVFIWWRHHGLWLPRVCFMCSEVSLRYIGKIGQYLTTAMHQQCA